MFDMKPIHTMSPLPPPAPAPGVDGLSFTEIIPLLLHGVAFTRREWADPQAWIAVHLLTLADSSGPFAVLALRKADGWHELIVSEADLRATDWMIVES